MPSRNSERSLLAIPPVTDSSWFVLLSAGTSCASSAPALLHERNVKTMNDTPTSEAHHRGEDEMLPEYDFDYRKARPKAYRTSGSRRRASKSIVPFSLRRSHPDSSALTPRRFCSSLAIPPPRLPRCAQTASCESAAPTLRYSAAWHACEVEAPALCSLLLQGVPYLVRRQGRIEMADADVRQRVHHRIGDGHWGRQCGQLANAFGA